MANLTSSFLGIKSPNPFWLASAPPTDKQYNVERAFKNPRSKVITETIPGGTKDTGLYYHLMK